MPLPPLCPGTDSDGSARDLRAGLHQCCLEHRDHRPQAGPARAPAANLPLDPLGPHYVLGSRHQTFPRGLSFGTQASDGGGRQTRRYRIDQPLPRRGSAPGWSGARDLNPGPHGLESHDSSSKHVGFCVFQFDSSSRRARSVQICTNLQPNYYMNYYMDCLPR